MIAIIKLLLAHLVGDFLLQPESWITAKESKRHRSWQLFAHASVHGVLSMIVIWDWRFLPWAMLIAVLHLLIDLTKVSFQNEHTRRSWFFVDQAMHFASICLIAYWYLAIDLTANPVFSDLNFALITALLFLTTPTSIAIKIIISKWTPDEGTNTESLQSAGKYIGILERLFVFVFIITGHWEGVGFLLAAKSIFRFGDLKEAKDRKLTEYVMIGTMLSFGIALLAALLFASAVR